MEGARAFVRTLQSVTPEEQHTAHDKIPLTINAYFMLTPSAEHYRLVHRQSGMILFPRLKKPEDGVYIVQQLMAHGETLAQNDLHTRTHYHWNFTDPRQAPAILKTRACMVVRAALIELGYALLLGE